MRVIVLAVVAIQIGLTHPALAETSLNAALPLFESNHCGAIRAPAEQLLCGDPELNADSIRLSKAVEDRLSRLANRRRAIAENAEWIRNRDSSCGTFGKQTIASQDIPATKACLLRETEERIAILIDPNFDCLATNTTA